MRLMSMDENTRQSDFSWTGLISTAGQTAADIITAVKAPGGSVVTPNVKPVYSPEAILSGNSGNTLIIVALAAVAIFLFMRK